MIRPDVGAGGAGLHPKGQVSPHQSEKNTGGAVMLKPDYCLKYHCMLAYQHFTELVLRGVAQIIKVKHSSSMVHLVQRQGVNLINCITLNFLNTCFTPPIMIGFFIGLHLLFKINQ